MPRDTATPNNALLPAAAPSACKYGVGPKWHFSFKTILSFWNERGLGKRVIIKEEKAELEAC